MALTTPRTQIVAILLTGCLTSASAQEPTISGMVPGALKPGGPQAVVFTGGNLQGARGLWTSVPVEATLAADVPENGKAADKVTLTVNVPAETPVGVHALRVVTDHGTSLVRLCVIDDLPSVAQAGAPTAMAPHSATSALHPREPKVKLNFIFMFASLGHRAGACQVKLKMNFDFS